MKKQFLYLLFHASIILLPPLSGFTQKIHGFIFCKTNPQSQNPDYLSTFDKGMLKNYHKMDSFCLTLSKAMKMPYIRHGLIGKDFNLDKIEKTLSAIKDISSEDLVILYFSTHGFISPRGDNIFPIVDIRDGNFVSTYTIYSKLIAHKPKFVLTLIDACSNYAELSPQDSFLVHSDWKPVLDKLSGTNNVRSVLNTNYLLLFRDCGQIISCAGQPGVTTYATSQGSIFTSAFLRVFNQTVNQKIGWLSWGRIFQQTKAIVLKESSMPGMSPHYPEWEISSCSAFIDSNKIYFNPAIDTLGSSRSFKGTGISTTTSKDKIVKGKYQYVVYVTAESDEPIDSVTYFLPNDRPDSVVTLRAGDWVDSLYSDVFILNHYDHPVLRGLNFEYRFIASESFTIKAKLFLKQQVKESFIRLEFNNKILWWKNLWVLFSFFLLLLLATILKFRKKIWEFFSVRNSLKFL